MAKTGCHDEWRAYLAIVFGYFLEIKREVRVFWVERGRRTRTSFSRLSMSTLSSISEYRARDIPSFAAK